MFELNGRMEQTPPPPDEPDPYDRASIEKWVKDGESMMKDIESGRHGHVVAIAFSLGMWWADRPWRKR